MQLVTITDPWWLTQCEAALMAEGIELRVDVLHHPRHANSLDVPTSELERASAILSDLLGDELARLRRKATLRAEPALWLRPEFAVALGSATLLIVFHALTGGVAERSEWMRRGALVTVEALSGDWWRLVTAATLHADWDHVLGNAAFLVLFIWAAAERLGTGTALVLWLVTAVAGFAVSLVGSQAHLTVGASGGLYGLLGVAALHAARHHDEDYLLRHQRLRTLGAGVLFLAYTAFGPRANIHAHVGGFVAGALAGWLSPRVSRGAFVQVGAAVATALAVAVAWLAAWS